MATPLTAAEESKYTDIIDGILATADMETVSRKQIRQGLEKAVDKDLSDQKNAIKVLIEARFDAISTEEPPAMPTPPSISANSEGGIKRGANGHAAAGNDEGDAEEEEEGEEEEAEDSAESEANGEIKVSLPPRKKQRRESDEDEDADARLAAELQAQENKMARSRTTRGGGTAKKSKMSGGGAKTPKKKKKSAKKVKAEDDSNASNSEGSAVPKRKAGGGFQKPFNLSYALQELVGETQLSRPQVVKKIWEHIKGNELQDPKDKRQIRCDDKMLAVFKQNTINMFSMNKFLGSHLYPVEEE